MLLRQVTSFGFPPRWIALLRAIYNVGSSRLLLNQHQSGSIRLTRGVRKCCPLSPLLFCLAIEPLANLIRQSTAIQGLTCGSTVLRIMLYEDDTTIFLKDAADLAEAERLIQIFAGISGAKVNAAKSELIPLSLNGPPLPGLSLFQLRPAEYQARLPQSVVRLDNSYLLLIGESELQKNRE